MKFDLKACCGDCPFLKGTDMVLQPGRMEGIVEHLQADTNVFPCHKTTHRLAPEGQDIDDEEGYHHHGREQACMGALAFNLRETGRLPVLARIALVMGKLKLDTLEAQFDKLTPAGEWETDR